MKPKHFLLIALLLAAGGVWLARSAWRTHAAPKSNMDADVKMTGNPNSAANNTASLPGAAQKDASPGPNNRPRPAQMLRPPEPYRRFTDFTPEQRVQFARQGHGPGG